MIFIAALLVAGEIPYDRALEVQQSLLVTTRNESLATFLHLYPDHPLIKRLTLYLDNPTHDEEEYFLTFNPTDPIEERIQEIFMRHQERVEHLFREGLVDINIP